MRTDGGDHNFNPRSPHGERRYVFLRTSRHFEISIHAPRMGSDAAIIRGKTSSFLFQSTLPAWGATSHALLIARTESSFQSTPPAWGATESFTNFRRKSIISIHAPRMGSDPDKEQKTIHYAKFQSTPPAWGATKKHTIISEIITISIHAPRMGSDSNALIASSSLSKFQSTPPAWGATLTPLRSLNSRRNFNPRPRMGSDQESLEQIGSCNISIHAPAWGATKKD